MDPDDLLARAKKPAPQVPQGDIHGRVLTSPSPIALGDSNIEAFSWNLVAWRSTAQPQHLAQLLSRTLESLFLAELSAPWDELSDCPAELRLVAFAELDPTALRPFAFEKIDNDDASHAIARNARGEAATLGYAEPGDAYQTWRVPFELSSLSIEAQLRALLGSEPFGQRPGACLAALNETRRHEQLVPFSPDLSGLDDFEREYVSTEHGKIRWLLPRLFQALCDFCGVVISSQGYKVDWAESELSEDELWTQPLFRISSADEREEFLPIGLHLLRWCVLPRLQGETIPSLAEWIASDFPNVTQGMD